MGRKTETSEEKVQKKKERVAQSAQGQQARKKRKRKMILGIVLIVVAAVLLGLAIYFMFFYEDEDEEASELEDEYGYLTTLDTYYTALLELDGETLYQCMAPDTYWDYYMETYDKTLDEIIATYDDACENTVEAWEEEAGGTIELVYDIVATSEPDSEGVDEWNENIEYEELTITDAITLEVELTILGDDTSFVETYMPTLVKMGDAWYILEEDSSTS